MTDFTLFLYPDGDTELELDETYLLAFRFYERLSGLDPTLDQDKRDLGAFAPDDGAPESVFSQRQIRHTPPVLGHDPTVQPPYYLRLLITPPRLPEGTRVADLINQSARLALTDENGETRHVRGLIQRALNRTGAYSRSSALELQVYPWLWAMALSEKCRVWTNITSVEVLKQLVAEYGRELPDTPRVDESALTETPRRRESIIQWHESDFEFASRLLERDGVFFHVTHDEDTTRIHLADASGQAAGAHGEGRSLNLIAADTSGDELFGDVVTHLTAQREAVPRRYAVADYNPVIADTPLRHASPAETDTAQTIYDYPGQVAALAEVSDVARRRYRSVENRTEVIYTAGRCPFLAPGSVHTAPSPWDPEEPEWDLRITQCVHELLRDGSGKPAYRAWAEAIRGEELFAPAQRTPIPAVEGTHNATVVSRLSETVDVDEHSRALVVFRWDPAQRAIRARLGQPWAGARHGTHVLPRHGDEVLVGFIQGSAEEPVILTSVHNSTTPKKLNPVQSRSATFDDERAGTPGPARQNRYVTSLHNASGNGLHFSDETEREIVELEAYRDFKLEVGHKQIDPYEVESESEIPEATWALDTVFEIGKNSGTYKKWEVEWTESSTISVEDAICNTYSGTIYFAFFKPGRPAKNRCYAIPEGTKNKSEIDLDLSTPVFENEQPVKKIRDDDKVPEKFKIYLACWSLVDAEGTGFETDKATRGAATIRTYGDLTIYVGKLTDDLTEYPASQHNKEQEVGGHEPLPQEQRGGMYTYVMGGTTHTVRGKFAFVTHPAAGYLVEASYKGQTLASGEHLTAALSQGIGTSASIGVSADYDVSAGFSSALNFDASVGVGGSYSVGLSIGAESAASFNVSLDPQNLTVSTPITKYQASFMNDYSYTVSNTAGNLAAEGRKTGMLTGFAITLGVVNGLVVTASELMAFSAAYFSDQGEEAEDEVKSFLKGTMPALSFAIIALTGLAYVLQLLLGTIWAYSRTAEWATDKSFEQKLEGALQQSAYLQNQKMKFESAISKLEKQPPTVVYKTKITNTAVQINNFKATMVNVL